MIYVGGARRASTIYLWEIVSKILQSKNKFTTISSQVIAQDKNLFQVIVNDKIMDTVFPINSRNFILLLKQKTSNSLNKNFISNINVEKEINGNIDMCSAFQTHTPIGKYLNSNLDKYIENYFFIHRNALDECVSILKAQATEYTKEKIIYDYKTNTINYHIQLENLKQAFNYLNYHSFNEIRTNTLSYLKHKKQENIYEFTFEKLTITNEIEEIERVSKILKIDIDAYTIQKELKKTLTSNSFWYTNSKKTNTSLEFFNTTMHNRLFLLLGDIQVINNYSSLSEYSSFLDEHYFFTLVFINIDESEDFENIFTKFQKKFNTFNLENIDLLKTSQKEKYIFFTTDYEQYLKIKKLENIDYIIYPYYEALLGFDDTMFFLQEQKQITLKYLAQQKNLIILDHTFNDEIILQKINYLYDRSSIIIETKNGSKPPSYLNSFTNIEVYLFGTGDIAKNLYLNITRYYKHIKIKGFIDSYKLKDSFFGLQVVHIDDIKAIKYDYIIIAFLDIEQGIKELKKRDIKNFFSLKNNFHIKTKKYTNTTYIDTFDLIKEIKNEITTQKNLIILSYSLELINKISKIYDGQLNIISLIPMYQYNNKTIFEAYKDITEN